MFPNKLSLPFTLSPSTSELSRLIRASLRLFISLTQLHHAMGQHAGAAPAPALPDHQYTCSLLVFASAYLRNTPPRWRAAGRMRQTSLCSLVVVPSPALEHVPPLFEHASHTCCSFADLSRFPLQGPAAARPPQTSCYPPPSCQCDPAHTASQNFRTRYAWP